MFKNKLCRVVVTFKDISKRDNIKWHITGILCGVTNGKWNNYSLRDYDNTSIMPFIANFWEIRRICKLLKDVYSDNVYCDVECEVIG